MTTLGSTGQTDRRAGESANFEINLDNDPDPLPTCEVLIDDNPVFEAIKSEVSLTKFEENYPYALQVAIFIVAENLGGEPLFTDTFHYAYRADRYTPGDDTYIKRALDNLLRYHPEAIELVAIETSKLLGHTKTNKRRF